MASDRHRSMNSIYQRPRRLQEEVAEGSVRRRRKRTANRRRGLSAPTPCEEEPEDEVVPVDESDDELVRQMEEEGPHEDDELEAAGMGSTSSDSSLSVYLRGPVSLPQAPLPHQRSVILPEGQK